MEFGDEDDDYLEEEEEEEAPAVAAAAAAAEPTKKRGGNYDVVFRKADDLQTIVKGMQPLLDDTFTVVIGDRELKVVELDKSHVSLVELRLKARWFLSYRPGSKPSLAFSLKHMVEMLRRIQPPFPLHMQNASWSDLQAWSAATSSSSGDRDDQPVTARDAQEGKDVTHFTYRDQYGSNVVHKQPLMVFEPNDTVPQFPDPDAVSTLRINPGRFKDMITRIRVSDPDDKNAAEKAVLNVLFQGDCITFSSEYGGSVRSIHQVYTPERTTLENVKRQRRLEQLRRRRDRCRDQGCEFTLSEQEREIMETPMLQVDHSVRITNYSPDHYCTTRLSMKYVLRTLANAKKFGPVMYMDVAGGEVEDGAGLTRIRYHLDHTTTTSSSTPAVGGKRKRSASSKPSKRRRRQSEDSQDENDGGDDGDDDEEPQQEQHVYENDDPGGVLNFWIGPKYQEGDDDTAQGKEKQQQQDDSSESEDDDVDTSAQKRFRDEFEDSESE